MSIKRLYSAFDNSSTPAPSPKEVSFTGKEYSATINSVLYMKKMETIKDGICAITYKKIQGKHVFLYDKNDKGQVFNVSSFNGKNYAIVVETGVIYKKAVCSFIRVFSLISS